MVKRNIKLNQAFVIKLFLIFLVVYLIFVTIRIFANSNFFVKKDRINIIFYGQKSSFVSLGLADDVDYVGFFDNGMKVYVPGGYGRYKVGALGRLADLEKNPKIIQKAFSSMLSAMVDFYFIPIKSPIFFEPKDTEVSNFSIPHLSPLDVLLNTKYITNASIVDKLFIFLTMFDKKRSNFSLIKTTNVKKDEDQIIFLEGRFDKKYQGYFYEKTLRDENKSGKIYYSSYKSAKIVSRILEGEGIRIVDLSEAKQKIKNCLVVEADNKISKTAAFLSRYFGCRRVIGNTDKVDIIIKLGDNLEKDWE